MQNTKLIKKLFRKSKKGKLKKFKICYLKFGLIGLKALESGVISYKQIESFKQIILKKTCKKIKIWIKIFPCFYTTKKPIGIRMGKGKGKISHRIYKITNGNIIIEICGSNDQTIINTIKLFKLKLPIKTKILKQFIFWFN